MHATAMLGTAGMKAREALQEWLSAAYSMGDVLRVGEGRPAPGSMPESIPATSARSP